MLGFQSFANRFDPPKGLNLRPRRRRSYLPTSETLPHRELLTTIGVLVDLAAVGATTSGSNTSVDSGGANDITAGNVVVSPTAGSVRLPIDITVSVTAEGGDTSTQGAEGNVAGDQYNFTSAAFGAVFSPFSNQYQGSCARQYQSGYTLSPFNLIETQTSVVGGVSTTIGRPRSVVVTLDSVNGYNGTLLSTGYPLSMRLTAQVLTFDQTLATWTRSADGTTLLLSGTNGADQFIVSQIDDDQPPTVQYDPFGNPVLPAWDSKLNSVLKIEQEINVLGTIQRVTIGTCLIDKDPSHAGITRLKIDGKAGDDSIVVDSSVNLPGGVVINGSMGNDTIVYNGPTNGTARTGVVINGNNGDDRLTLTGLLDGAVVNGGDGSDTIDVLAATLTNARIDAGAVNATGAVDSSVDIIYLPVAYDGMLVNMSVSTLNGVNDLKRRKR